MCHPSCWHDVLRRSAAAHAMAPPWRMPRTTARTRAGLAQTYVSFACALAPFWRPNLNPAQHEGRTPAVSAVQLPPVHRMHLHRPSRAQLNAQVLHACRVGTSRPQPRSNPSREGRVRSSPAQRRRGSRAPANSAAARAPLCSQPSDPKAKAEIRSTSI